MTIRKSSFLGESRAIHELRRLASRLANAAFPIVIEGETGTGKYELALLLHERSSRSREPFVDVHCANLDDVLFESTLFGHERGAFTDARERRVGRLDAARAGTVLFDEVDCLTPMQQAKLLRVIDRRAYERVGGTETLTTAAHFLFTSNRSLRQLASARDFRSDLLYRVSWFVLQIPPLRQRPEDIALLATLLLEETRSNDSLPRMHWSSGAMEALRAHPWMGNVRELKSAVQVVAYLHEDGESIGRSEVERILRATSEFAITGHVSEGLFELRTDAERRLIADALKATEGNRVRAARLLKIGRRTLQVKIAKYGL
jgi:DNA-binding NtrC family response regulator